MAVVCSGCGHTFDERQLPALSGIRVICPNCSNPVDLSSTIPIDQEAIGTLESKNVTGGALSDVKRYAVVVLEGKSKGQVFPLSKPNVTIGRIQCDITLNDTEVSRQHALLTVHGSEARLQDLGSTNGTFVGESQVREAQIQDRTEFRIGSHQLMFVIADQNEEFPAH
jgi:hypothetical protein